MCLLCNIFDSGDAGCACYSTDSGGGGETNISERRTPLSHLLGRCAPPRRVILHRGGGGVRVRHAAG